MAIVADAKLAAEKCDCGGDLLLVVGRKDPSARYLRCGECNYIATAIDGADGWAPKPKPPRRETGLTCPVCKTEKMVEIEFPERTVLFCNTRTCSGRVWCAEKSVIRACDCGAGFRFHDTTKSGKKLSKCSNRACAWVEWEDEKCATTRKSI